MSAKIWTPIIAKKVKQNKLYSPFQFKELMPLSHYKSQGILGDSLYDPAKILLILFINLIYFVERPPLEN